MPSGRNLLLSGYMNKRGGGGGLFGSTDWKRRYFVLDTEGVVRYYKSDGSENPQGHFQLLGAEVVAIGVKGLEVRGAANDSQSASQKSSRVYVIEAESEKSRDTWLAAFISASNSSSRGTSFSWTGAQPKANAPSVPLVSDTLTTMGAPPSSKASIPPAPPDDSARMSPSETRNSVSSTQLATVPVPDLQRLAVLYAITSRLQAIKPSRCGNEPRPLDFGMEQQEGVDHLKLLETLINSLEGVAQAIESDAGSMVPT